MAFLPVNPIFSPLRNQARQKLAMLDKGQFSQILVDVLNECLYRQKRSMETGVWSQVGVFSGAGHVHVSHVR